MELGERKQKILTAIIDSYIQTGEPVGSKALVEMLGNAVSSATIRNEMAELASWGYLEQPHTSAGRIPTAKAFRLYIDHLMRRQALSDEDQKDIDDMLAGSAGDPERLSARRPRRWPRAPAARRCPPPLPSRGRLSAGLKSCGCPPVRRRCC